MTADLKRTWRQNRDRANAKRTARRAEARLLRAQLREAARARVNAARSEWTGVQFHSVAMQEIQRGVLSALLRGQDYLEKISPKWSGLLSVSYILDHRTSGRYKTTVYNETMYFGPQDAKHKLTRRGRNWLKPVFKQEAAATQKRLNNMGLRV